MLNRESLETALPLVELLDRANKAVVPREGSPLATLVGSSRTNDWKFPTPVNGTIPVYQPSLYDIEYLTNSKDNVGGVCEHDIALDAVVEMATKGAQAYQTVIKNGVIPAVHDLYEKVAKAMQDMPISKLLGLEVKVYDLPGPVKSPAIESLISKWVPVAHATPALRMKCPDVTMEDLNDLMKTGASALDSEIAKWVATKGDSFFLQLWEDLFQQKNDNWSKFADAINCKEHGIDRALAIFLIARKLGDAPLEGTRMSLPELKTLASEYRDQAAAKIDYALQDWANIKKKNILVRRTNDGCVEVNETVYRPWVTTGGGSNELLFGSLAKKTGYITTQQINDAGPELLKEWTRLQATSKMTERNEKFRQLKQLLLGEFKKSLNDLAGGDPQADSGASDRDAVLQLFKTELNRYRIDECDDLHDLCLKLICRSRFVATPEAETFIRTMMVVEKDNPNITPREAACIAMIEYVSCWVASQMKVVQATGT